MEIYFIINLILLGFIFGSFLNVVSLRFNTGKSLNGRSMCFSCAKTLQWFELIPVVSWLIQKGRCRGCSSRISFELLLSEIVTGVFFGLIAARGFFVDAFILDVPYIISTIYLVSIFSLLVVVLFYDMRHKIIPDELSLTFGLVAFAGMFFFGFQAEVFNYVGFHIPNIWNILAGLLIPLPFVLIWYLSKGSQIGLGDPKLMVGIGFLLGLSKGFSAIFFAFWIGALFALSLIIVNKIFHKKLVSRGKKSIMKTEIPFAPFLIVGTFIVLISGLNILFI